jgi:hypothetical protein
MEFVRYDSLSLLKPERQQAITEFFEQARDFLLERGCESDYLIDVICDEGDIWDDVLMQPWVKNGGPLEDTRGNLDILAVFLAEGKSLETALLKSLRRGHETYRRELEHGGLHNLHFRMGLCDSAQRMKYAIRLADELFAVDPNEYRLTVKPLRGMSALSANRAEGINCFFGGDHGNFRTLKGLTQAQIKLLLGDTEPSTADALDVAVEILLREGEKTITNVNQKRMATRIETALIPMVYNHGYLLKAHGASVDEICKKVSINIDSLLKFIEAEPAFKEALKQQILINLFSPFEEGLIRLNATQESLQGVHGPSLTEAAEDGFFNETLCGPMRLFRAWDSVKYSERCAQIIEFFNETSMPLSFEISANGLLAGKTEVVELLWAHNEKGYSAVLDKALAGPASEIVINEHLLTRLMRPETLRLYSDPATVRLIDLSLDHFKKQARISGSGVRTIGFKGIGGIFQERPHLREGVLDLLHQKELLLTRMFEFCGFGQRELRLLGSKAPNALKQALLENSMGL